MFESIGELEKQVEEFQKNILASNSLISALSEITETIRSLEKSMADEVSHLLEQSQSTIDDTTKTLVSTNEQCLTNISSKFNHNHEEYAQKLAQLCKATEEMKGELEQKYGTFIKELHETNLDQVSKDIQLLKKGVNSKFTLAYVGIAISIIASILSIVLR